MVTIDDPTGEDAVATATIGGPLAGRHPEVRRLAAGPERRRVPTTSGSTSRWQFRIRPPIRDRITTRSSSDSTPSKLHSDLPATTAARLSADQHVGSHRQPVPLPGAAHRRQARHAGAHQVHQQACPPARCGDLFLPVDTTVMGAGMGPWTCPACPGMMEMYTQNRATLHLHGGLVPWISDGTPHQWTTPAGESDLLSQGRLRAERARHARSGRRVADLLLHQPAERPADVLPRPAYGITRLNVYAGEAAGYLITDQVEQDLINGTNVSGVNPGLRQDPAGRRDSSDRPGQDLRGRRHHRLPGSRTGAGDPCRACR